MATVCSAFSNTVRSLAAAVIPAKHDPLWRQSRQIVDARRMGKHFASASSATAVTCAIIKPKTCRMRSQKGGSPSLRSGLRAVQSAARDAREIGQGTRRVVEGERQRRA